MNRLTALFAFLALLDPLSQKPQLSLPAVAFWVTLIVIVYLSITSPGNVSAVLAALAGFVPSVLTFAQQSWQNHQQQIERIRKETK
jgi:hypothetical protein